MKRLLGIAVSLMLAGATILLFDLVAWFVLPAQYTAFSASYRKTALLGAVAGIPPMARAYPRNYFRADPVLGFDIVPNMRMTHDFEVVPHEIFSNDLGCFDRNQLADFRRAPEYHYFAGDSFTWGYADYDSKFATVWEKQTGRMAAKCGVTHTGQAYQLEKLKRVAAAIGKFPATVFVGFYVNDPGNDEAFPHTTVVSGYQVDTAFLKGGAIVHADVNEVRRVVEQGLRALEAPPGLVSRIRSWLSVYSLSANIANHLLVTTQGALQRDDALAPSQRAIPAPTGPMAGFGNNLYYWYPSDAMKTRYASDPMTAANRAAIQRWAAHARENSYRLVFLLFPPQSDFNDVEFFSQVRGWLDANGIEHLDFARLFADERVKVDDLHWKSNGHWHNGGNRTVGRLLAERYPAGSPAGRPRISTRGGQASVKGSPESVRLGL